MNEKEKLVFCAIYCMGSYTRTVYIDDNIFDYKDKARERLYEIVYSKLEEKFRKHNENFLSVGMESGRI